MKTLFGLGIDVLIYSTRKKHSRIFGKLQLSYQKTRRKKYTLIVKRDYGKYGFASRCF